MSEDRDKLILRCFHEYALPFYISTSDWPIMSWERISNSCERVNYVVGTSYYVVRTSYYVVGMS